MDPSDTPAPDDPSRPDRIARPARRRPPAGRAPLTRERIVAAAFDLADADGTDALSMRTLARALDVQPMSLYNHVRDKEDVLDGLAERVLGEIEVPPAGTPWRQAMEVRARSARAVFGRHPWAIAVTESRTTPLPGRLTYVDAVLARLLEGGFPIDLAGHAFFLLDSYLYGFVLQEQVLPLGDATGLAAVGEGFAGSADLPRHPALGAMIRHAMEAGYDYAEEFERGLALILDGLERELARRRG